MAGQTYLIDHATFRPPAELRVIVQEAEEHGKHWKMYKEEHIEFMLKVFQKSGLSPNGTYLPACIHPKHTQDPKNDITSALQEAEMVMTGAVSELLEKLAMKPSDIDILVTCTSIFCPTPSAASMLVNRFKMRSDIQTYHLGGMGCGTGVVGVNLIRDLLKARPNSTAVFVPSEITSYCFYDGQEKNRMVSNVIFRMGGAAVMFSNKPALRPVAKYQLLHSVRVHHAANDESYGCMSWGPDKDGVNGVYLGKNVITCAGAAIEAAIRLVAPKILTWSQYGEAALSVVRKKLASPEGVWGAASALIAGGTSAVPADYVPDFTKCVDHFVIHAGGYAVLKGIQDRLKLPAAKMLPSFATLQEYGNTSCSTTWYALGYAETCEKIKKGQTVLQIGVGGGVKAGANVWKALRNIEGDRAVHTTWEHLQGKPLTEADLPRGIDGGDLHDDVKAIKSTWGDKPGASKAVAKPVPSEVEVAEEEVEAL